MNRDNKEPFVSFVIPSYNSQKHIKQCLASIEKQKYPKEKIEILLIDGGSNDLTLEIAGRFSVKIINNPNRIAEFAKSIGIQESKGEYLVILDSDNEIAQADWLLKNILALENDSSLIGMDSVFLVKKDDFLVNRYCALLGLEDPLVRYMADLASNSDVEGYPNYAIYKIRKGRFPIFGSNGFIWRKRIFEEVGNYVPRYDEAEFCIKVIESGYNKIGFVKEAGIYHHHVENISQFIKKRIRRGKEFLGRKFLPQDIEKDKPGVWLDRHSNWELLKSAFLCLSFVYPAYESLKGYERDKDIAWFLHPFLSFLTAITYSIILFRFMTCQYTSYVLKLKIKQNQF